MEEQDNTTVNGVPEVRDELAPGQPRIGDTRPAPVGPVEENQTAEPVAPSQEAAPVKQWLARSHNGCRGGRQPRFPLA